MTPHKPNTRDGDPDGLRSWNAPRHGPIALLKLAWNRFTNMVTDTDTNLSSQTDTDPSTTYIVGLEPDTSIDWVRGFLTDKPVTIDQVVNTDYIVVSGHTRIIENLHLRDQFSSVEVEGHGHRDEPTQ